MSSRERVMAAILAAINEFEAEEALAVAAPRVAPQPPYAVNVWKYAGLQETMNMRRLWQLRLTSNPKTIVIARRRN
jgi:hypothetical protein